MPNCGSLSLVLATEIDCRSSFKFNWTSWHTKFYEDIKLATLHAVLHILLVLCLPATCPSACGLQSLLPPWTQKTLLELILQLGLKYTELCIHCQFILVIINSKMCALWQLFIYICLRFMPVSAATEVKHILFNISGPHCFGWFAQLTTGMFYSLVSLHCRLAVDIRFLIFEYCGNRIFFCYHI